MGYKSLLTLILICTSVSTLPAIAQDGPPAYQHLKPLEPMIGEWTGDFDPPGPSPTGKLIIRFEWMGNRSYLQSSVRFQPAGQPADKMANPEFTVLGYDFKASVPKAWVFKYTEQGKLDAVIEKARLVLSQQEGESNEPNFRRQTKTYEINDDDELVVTTTGESFGGKQSSEPAIKLQRIK